MATARDVSPTCHRADFSRRGGFLPRHFSQLWRKNQFKNFQKKIIVSCVKLKFDLHFLRFYGKKQKILYLYPQLLETRAMSSLIVVKEQFTIVILCIFALRRQSSKKEGNQSTFIDTDLCKKEPSRNSLFKLKKSILHFSGQQ